MMLAWVTTAEGEEQKYTFSQSTVLIGRGPGNDIHLRDTRSSRYHARLSLENQVVVVQDLNSTNGVFVNGAQVQCQELRPNDELRIGDTLIRISLSEQTPAATEIEEEIGETDTESQEEVSEPAEASLQPASSSGSASASDVFFWDSLKHFLQPVWEFIEDESISEILVNGPEHIYIERAGQLLPTSACFTEASLSAAVLNISQYVARPISEAEPYFDARLPDGSRVAVLLPPCSRQGITVAIRKFGKQPLTIERLLAFGSLSEEMHRYLAACVILKKNILVSGGTSSGKTSLLNALSSLIPRDERIITIEDSAELRLNQEHVVQMETRPADKRGRGQVAIRDLVRVSLRMRPDRIIVGEIRGAEALDLLQAMNTGHSGSMATVHANDPRQSLTRMETLALFSGIDIPLRALREQVAAAVDVVVQAARLPDKSRRVTVISEILPLNDDGSYAVNEIFSYCRSLNEEGATVGRHQLSGNRSSFVEQMRYAGLEEAISLFSGLEQ